MIGVTVLTSHDSASLLNIGINESPRQAVVRLAEALKAGACYLMVGRPITGATDPVAAAKSLFE